jgi:hypothetical protein
MKKIKKNMKKSKKKLKRAEVEYREELMCFIEVIKREKNKKETISITRQERRHSRTRKNNHKF